MSYFLRNEIMLDNYIKTSILFQDVYVRVNHLIKKGMFSLHFEKQNKKYLTVYETI